MLEDDARSFAIRLQPEAHPRIDDWSAGRPREHEPTGRFALQHLAAHHQPIETNLGIRRHAKREMMADARLEVVGKHPLGERRAVGECPPDLLPRLRYQNLSLDRFGHSLLFLDSSF